jgi:thymidylate kinase
VRDGFHHMASEDPSRWCVIDGTGDPASIASLVRDAVRERLGI